MITIPVNEYCTDCSVCWIIKCKMACYNTHAFLPSHTSHPVTMSYHRPDILHIWYTTACLFTMIHCRSFCQTVDYFAMPHYTPSYQDTLHFHLQLYNRPICPDKLQILLQNCKLFCHVHDILHPHLPWNIFTLLPWSTANPSALTNCRCFCHIAGSLPWHNTDPLVMIDSMPLCSDTLLTHLVTQTEGVFVILQVLWHDIIQTLLSW